MQKYIFPVCIIALNLGSAISFACGGDIRKTIYFIAAAVLNITVTF